jgi:ABC-type glutathione transport system ATPase component
MAVACEPGLILADEPTTALDPPLAVQIQALLRDLVRRTGAALLIVTHDLGTVARLADEVGVLAGGRLVEYGAAANVLQRPQHKVTRRLLADRPGGRPLSAGGDASSAGGRA